MINNLVYLKEFGRNVRSAFGNYAEKVREDFSKISEAFMQKTGKIGGKRHIKMQHLILKQECLRVMTKTDFIMQIKCN